MPRKLAVHHECDRCGRVWFEDYIEGDKLPKTSHLKVEMQSAQADGVLIQFDVLCAPCETTVQNYLESIRAVQKKSPERGAKKKTQDEPGSEEVEVLVEER